MGEWRQRTEGSILAEGAFVRYALIGLFVLASMLTPPSARAVESAASGDRGVPPHVAILNVRLVDGHVVRIDLATSGLDAPGMEPPTVDLSVLLDGVPARAALPLIHMPPRFSMDLDLPVGVVRVGGIPVGSFTPVPRFRENLRFPVDVTVRRGQLAATARQITTFLLPTVIVPGYLNEFTARDEDAIASFVHRGYDIDNAAPTLFWFTYPSRDASLDDAARALAAYVRRAVLPRTYAARINVVGFSLGGLMARWNVAHDVDGWGTLVNRLVLVGVPNEGSVMAYVGEHAPFFVPFSGFGRTVTAAMLTPTFPFWRAAPGEGWRTPPDAQNTILTQLNALPLPAGIRVYIFYGSHAAEDSAGPLTASGITGALPGTDLSFAAGDGVVLSASAQGLPIHGNEGVPALAERTILRVDLGAVYHTRLLDAGAGRIADALFDRFASTVDEAGPAPSTQEGALSHP